MAMAKKEISDRDWLDALCEPEQGRRALGLQLPLLPPDEVQRSFTGQAGRGTLEQANHFYLLCRRVAGLEAKENPTILDFGAGWGRISRFFLRDTAPENLLSVDCLSDAVEWLEKTEIPSRIVHCGPLPPLPFQPANVDLIVAFSVFSHLSEGAFTAWMQQFRSIISDTGRLVFTSRGKIYLQYLERLVRTRPAAEWPGFLKQMGDLELVLEKYERGQFQFFPRNAGGELDGSFFGEAYVPKAYLADREKELGFRVVQSFEAIEGTSQAVFVVAPV